MFPETRPIVTKGPIATPVPNLRDAVDHDLAVKDVYARLHDHRIADVDPGDHDREAMADLRQDRHPPPLERRPDAIDRLGKEGVARPAEPENLEHGAGAAPGRGPIPVHEREAGIRDHGMAKRRVARPALAHQDLARMVV